jgi:hypothetical protein
MAIQTASGQNSFTRGEVASCLDVKGYEIEDGHGRKL